MVYAHRLLLARCSPVFASMLGGSFVEGAHAGRTRVPLEAWAAPLPVLWLVAFCTVAGDCGTLPQSFQVGLGYRRAIPGWSSVFFRDSSVY